MPDITLSVVLYRDYKSPMEMIESLVEKTSNALDVKLYAVDNSDLAQDDVLAADRASFIDYSEKSDFVEYIDAGANLGFGAANNLALLKSGAPYHVFVNPDVLFVEDALLKLKRYMDANPDVGMCIPRMVDESGELQRVYRRDITVLDAFNRMFLKNALKGRDKYHTMACEDYTKPFQVPFGQGSFLFGRTSLLKELDGFDDRYFMYLEDADLCKRVNNSSKLMYCPDATVVHKWERGSHKNPALLKHHVNSYVAYFKKWGIKFV